MLNEVLLCVLHLAVGGNSDVKWPHVQEESSQAAGTGESSPAEKGNTVVTVTLALTIFILPMVAKLVQSILIPRTKGEVLGMKLVKVQVLQVLEAMKNVKEVNPSDVLYCRKCVVNDRICMIDILMVILL